MDTDGNKWHGRQMRRWWDELEEQDKMWRRVAKDRQVWTEMEKSASIDVIYLVMSSMVKGRFFFAKCSDEIWPENLVPEDTNPGIELTSEERDSLHFY